jgi:uncharacterized membrane protein
MALLAFFGLWETTLLAGATAVSVPVVIHLLNRRRYRIVTWAAMRFLMLAQKQNSRRMRLEQVLLLLCRMALIACVLLAMASITPWAENVWAYLWPDAAGGVKTRTARVHHLIVLDGSLSMNQGTEDSSCFDHAKELVLRKIGDAPAGDGFTVLLLKEHPEWIIGENAPSQDKRRAARELNDVRVAATHGNASVPTALNMISAKLVDNQKRFPGQAVYFFTDMQKATWALPSSDSAKDTGGGNSVLADIGKHAKIVFVDVGKDEVSNQAVTDLRIDDPFVTTSSAVPIIATVQNFGNQRKDKLRVELHVGRAREAANDPSLALKRVDVQNKDVAPGGSVSVVFNYKFPQAGTYAVQVRIEDDALLADNFRSMIVTVKDHVDVLLVNGNSATSPFDRATEYVRYALDPRSLLKKKDPAYKESIIRANWVTATAFRSMNQTKKEEKQLLGYDALFFCDVGPIDEAEVDRLKMFLRMGGGVIFAAGPEVWRNREAHNTFLFDKNQLLPGPYKNLPLPPEGDFLFDTQASDFKQPPLKAFEDEKDKIALNSARFQKYMPIEVPDQSSARTIMTFHREEAPLVKGDPILLKPTNHPALLEFRPPLPKIDPTEVRPKDAKKGPIAPQRYRGKVIVFASTLNLEWGSWPLSPSFLPMMNELTRLAVSGKLRGNSQIVGEVLEDAIPSDGVEVVVEVSLIRTKTQAGEAEVSKPTPVRTQAQGDVSIFRRTETDLSGIYSVYSPKDFQERLFAVNCPSGTAEQNDNESDLSSRFNKSMLKEIYKGSDGWDNLQVVKDPSDAYLPSPEAREDMDNYVEQLSPIGPNIAHGLLLAVLVLLLLEVVLAWRFGRHSKVDGATSPPAVSKTWPITIAVVAGLIFSGLVFVGIHTHRTGDFLSFLPEEMRSRCEKFLGVPPAPAGEGTFWELVSRPDLFGVGNDFWPSLGVLLAGLCLIFYVYRVDGPQVSAVYRTLLAGLRLFLLLFVLFVLLPQLQLRFDRQSWPDVVLIIDDSRSMGEPDNFTNAEVKARAAELGKIVLTRILEKLPDRITSLERELAVLDKKLRAKEDDLVLKAEKEHLDARLKTWQSQLDQAKKKNEGNKDSTWTPSRLQLVQALLSQPEMDWLDYLVNKRSCKVHIYHLDAVGRAIKLVAGQGAAIEITESDPQQLAAAHQAVSLLEPEGNDSRLGTAVRQVVDHYRGGSATVIMFTDGVTTRDETIREVAEYAGNKGIPLFFVGIGDAHEVRDLHLYDLQVEDVVRVNDTLNFQAKLVGKGIKGTSVPVILKMREKDGKEVELGRKIVKVDEHSWSKFTLQHKPKQEGTKVFIVELEVPKKDPSDKTPSGNRRLERTINVLENTLIRVLLVDGTPRYEYRFLKSLLERETVDENNNRSIELKVVLLDADKDYALQDRTALKEGFPATTEELSKYDVIVFGDCDPRHAQLGEQRLNNLYEFVNGASVKGKTTVGKPGGGMLFIAGTAHNPHSYKGTVLEKILPIVPMDRPSEEDFRDQQYHLKWTASGRQHQIFKFIADEGDSQNIWLNLAPMYWWSRGYKVAPAAEVLAVHENKRADNPRPGQDQNHPLIVQQFVGSGRTMFFGFDESWRWRFRENEPRYNSFWVQTIRYLSRLRISHTDLRLNQQTPYRQGEKPKVFVTFPDTMPLPDESKQQVKVQIEYFAKDKNEADPETMSMTLERPGGGGRRYEGDTPRELRRPGKYHYKLLSPDVRKTQPGGENPSADATVEVPPGELEKLQLNEADLKYAAEKTDGGYYTLANADKLLTDIKPARVSLSTPWPPVILWSNTLCFLVVLGLLTAEWLLRKRKHLL